jgi:hypothetical protein
MPIFFGVIVSLFLGGCSTNSSIEPKEPTIAWSGEAVFYMEKRL